MNLQWPHLVFLFGGFVYVAIRAVYQLRRAAEKRSISKATPLDWLLVMLVVMGQVVFPLILLFTPWMNWANDSRPVAVVLVGGAIMSVGLWLFWRSHANLGESWSVTLELNDNHRLITHGVYRYLRHPMYASFFLLAISQILLLENWLAGCAALVAVTLLYLVRIPHEERMMLEYFGEEYRIYKMKTYGIVPSRPDDSQSE